MRSKLSLVLFLAVVPPFWLPQTHAQTSSDGWRSLENCPVLEEQLVEVPALESGVLAAFEVQLNQAVESGQTLARLDTELAQMELRIAELQFEVAKQLADDDSDVKYHDAALSVVQIELANLEKIGSSVSAFEMRRARLSVEKAQQAKIRAEQAKSRASVEAKLKAATVETAKTRLQRCQVSAPLKGVVSAILRHPGQWVKAGEAIAKIRNLDHLIVDRLIPVREVDLTTLVGSPVRVEVLAPNGEQKLLSGSMASYDHEVSSQGLIRVHARIANIEQSGHWLLLPGMNVKMYVAAKHFQPGTLPATTDLGPGRFISK